MTKDLKYANLLCLFLIFLIPFYYGCSAKHNKQLDEYNKLYSSGKYSEVASVQMKNLGDNKSDPSNLLCLLQTGTALRYSMQFDESNSIFDTCEDIIKVQNEKLMAQNALADLGAVLVNDSVLDYEGTEYDGIMINTYKALNFWQQGEKDLARVAFNRALERQRRAKERFAAKIQQQKEAIAKKQEEEKKKAEASKSKGETPHPTLDIYKNLENPEITERIKNNYSNLYEFQAYPDFINPFTTYMAGLFFMSEGDYKKADDLLKETYGMVGENPIVADDFISVENRLEGKRSEKNYVWVIFENGLGPIKKEFRVDLPLFIFSNNVKYTGIALPKLKLRKQAYPYLTLKDSSKEICNTCELASMDRVVQTEFKNEYNLILTRAIMCTLTKTCAQYMATRQYGDLGGLAAACYQAATNSADLRIWSALPKEFQLAKISPPKNGQLTVQTPSGNAINVQVPTNNSSLVYVKIPASGANIVHDVISF